MTAPLPNRQGADRLFNAHKSITFLGVCKSEEVKFFRLFSHCICKKLYLYSLFLENESDGGTAPVSAPSPRCNPGKKRVK